MTNEQCAMNEKKNDLHIFILLNFRRTTKFFIKTDGWRTLVLFFYIYFFCVSCYNFIYMFNAYVVWNACWFIFFFLLFFIFEWHRPSLTLQINIWIATRMNCFDKMWFFQFIGQYLFLITQNFINAPIQPYTYCIHSNSAQCTGHSAHWTYKFIIILLDHFLIRLLATILLSFNLLHVKWFVMLLRVPVMLLSAVHTKKNFPFFFLLTLVFFLLWLLPVIRSIADTLICTQFKL